MWGKNANNYAKKNGNEREQMSAHNTVLQTNVSSNERRQKQQYKLNNNAKQIKLNKIHINYSLQHKKNE